MKQTKIRVLSKKTGNYIYIIDIILSTIIFFLMIFFIYVAVESLSLDYALFKDMTHFGINLRGRQI